MIISIIIILILLAIFYFFGKPLRSDQYVYHFFKKSWVYILLLIIEILATILLKSLFGSSFIVAIPYCLYIFQCLFLVLEMIPAIFFDEHKNKRAVFRLILSFLFVVILGIVSLIALLSITS
ncbi:hypothetical protein JOD45_000308 [Scopulibacillus daqui]|uniref:DUF4181 domain-containing protein n=1 Tax=Scopulibacillus daqui TaxID=1469162 RepID=A0ABS2PVP5_9BACL|nr:hypothetical protein [Scopulibacillus daqui]